MSTNTGYRHDIDEAMRRADGSQEKLNINWDKPVVVAIFSVNGVGNLPILQHLEVLNGTAAWINIDLIAKKAKLVALTGCTCEEAKAKAIDLDVTLLGGWVEDITDFWGAAPIVLDDRLQEVAVVSGQQHKEIDQRLAEMIAQQRGVSRLR